MGCKFLTWPEEDLEGLKVDVTTDMETVHPSLFCHRCWTAAMRGGGFCSFTRTQILDWKPHTSNCDLCFPKKSSFKRIGRKRAKSLKSAHRLPKRIKRDSSEFSGANRVWRQTTENTTVSGGKELLKLSVQRGQWVKNITQCQTDHLSTKLIPTEVPADFIRAVTCQVCDHLLSDPVQSACRHLFCRVCILRYSRALGPNCPTCNQHLNPSHLTRQPNIPCHPQLSPSCSAQRGCSNWVRLDSFREHCLNHYHEKESQEEQTPSDQNIDGYLPVNKGWASSTAPFITDPSGSKAQAERLKEPGEGFCWKRGRRGCEVSLFDALPSGVESWEWTQQADELEAMMQGTAKKHITHNMWLS